TQSDEARELAPSVGPEFAAPEQLLKGEIDFRSEMYSLGATMCFLLTGTVPLPTSGPTSRARLRHSPALRRVPRRLRKLLAFVLPHFAPFSHREKREIGVPVGTSNNNEPVKVAPIVVKQPAAPAPPIDQQNLSPNSQPENASAGQPVPASTTAAVTDQSAERSDSIGQTAQSSTNAPLSEDTA